MLQPSTLQTINESGTRGTVEPSSRTDDPRTAVPRGVRPAVDPLGPNSDRRRHSRHDDQDAQHSPRLPEDGTPSPISVLAKGTTPVPRYGPMVRASTRAPPMLSRLPGRNPKTERSSGQTVPYAEVPVGLLAPVLAFNDAHEHRLSTVQPRAPNGTSEDIPKACPCFRVDSLCSAWLAERQHFLAGGFGLSPFRQRHLGQVIRLGSPRDVLPRLFSESRRMLAHSPAPYVTPQRRFEEEPSKRMPRGLGNHVPSRPHEGTRTRAPKAPSTISAVSGRSAGPQDPLLRRTA